MKFLFRALSLVALLALGSVGACSSEGGPCGVCPSGQRCDVNKKKCVKRSYCVSCQTSAECENEETCVNGCCKSSGQSQEQAGTDSQTSDASVVADSFGGEGPQEAAPQEKTSCTQNSDCQNPSTPVCDLFQKICVECFQSADCASGECNNGVCKKAGGKCAGVSCPLGQSCNPTTGACLPSGPKQTCEACTKNSECEKDSKCAGLGGAKKSCLPSCETRPCQSGFDCLTLGASLGKLCIPQGECKAKSRCDGVTCTGAKKCCPATGKCQQCCEDKDCSPNQKCIAVGSNQQCSNTNSNACKPACAAGEVCNTQTGTCQKNCSKGGCPNASQVCDPGSGLCVRKDCRSNWTCRAGTVCNPSTGLCGRETDCRKRPGLCSGTQCCSNSTGKCVTDCRQCTRCPVQGQTCNQTTGACEAPKCQMKSPCSGSSQCCGLKCEFSLGNLKDMCKCKRDSDCGPGYRCKSSLLNKYCEK